MILSLHDLQQTEQHIITRMDLQTFSLCKKHCADNNTARCFNNSATCRLTGKEWRWFRYSHNLHICPLLDISKLQRLLFSPTRIFLAQFFCLATRWNLFSATCKATFTRTVFRTVFVRGTFLILLMYFNVMCKQYHRNSLNPFWNGEKKTLWKR